MITRLEVDGFKSLRDFAVDLEPLTVFVGPNSAGKSNVLDALALLSRLASDDVMPAFKQGRGRAHDQFTRRGGQAGAKIRFAVELPARRHTGEEKRFRYELTIARNSLPSGAERLEVEAERLLVQGPSHRPGLRADEPRSAPGPAGSRWSPSGLDSSVGATDVMTGEKTTALRAHAALKAGDARAVADELASYRLLHIDAAHLAGTSERLGDDALAADGSNLPTVLAYLPGPMLGDIRADLVSLVPGISSFDVVPDDDAFRLDFELSGGERLPARLVSDGTLRILALLTALRVEPRPSVVGVEEPENGVYPGRLRKLLDYLQEIAAQTGEGSPAPTQLLLTTHSPVVLAALRAHTERLRFVDLVRRDGQLVTRARTVAATSGPDRGQRTVSLREIDELLQAADSEIGQ